MKKTKKNQLRKAHKKKMGKKKVAPPAKVKATAFNAKEVMMNVLSAIPPVYGFIEWIINFIHHFQ